MVDAPQTTEITCTPPATLPMDDGDIASVDPEMAELIALEKQRQIEGIELIASENFTSKAVIGFRLLPHK